MPARANRRVLRIEFGHCDPAQIVYYPNYVAWVDQSTHHLFESVGLPLRRLQSELRLQVPVVDLNVKFLGPACWGDEIEIESCIERWGTKSFDVLHDIHSRSSGAKIAAAKETRVCVEIDPNAPQGLKGRSVPDEVKAAFE